MACMSLNGNIIVPTILKKVLLKSFIYKKNKNAAWCLGLDKFKQVFCKKNNKQTSVWQVYLNTFFFFLIDFDRESFPTSSASGWCFYSEWLSMNKLDCFISEDDEQSRSRLSVNDRLIIKID